MSVATWALALAIAIATAGGQKHFQKVGKGKFVESWTAGCSPEGSSSDQGLIDVTCYPGGKVCAGENCSVAECASDCQAALSRAQYKAAVDFEQEQACTELVDAAGASRYLGVNFSRALLAVSSASSDGQVASCGAQPSCNGMAPTTCDVIFTFPRKATLVGFMCYSCDSVTVASEQTPFVEASSNGCCNVGTMVQSEEQCREAASQLRPGWAMNAEIQNADAPKCAVHITEGNRWAAWNANGKDCSNYGGGWRALCSQGEQTTFQLDQQDMFVGVESDTVGISRITVSGTGPQIDDLTWTEAGECRDDPDGLVARDASAPDCSQVKQGSSDDWSCDHRNPDFYDYRNVFIWQLCPLSCGRCTTTTTTVTATTATATATTVTATATATFTSTISVTATETSTSTADTGGFFVISGARGASVELAAAIMVWVTMLRSS
eukprot:gb/GFBE01031068.1/.p1 GENE.gb/GFBE01031068.1/~~gb/GFBE01031068.1/.p1  ORF type:complete len:437 (+),score=70.68 gb/GFBE01031068.1/:1-1311(+)